ncbi:MAG: TlpA family protein disulfide reductase [Saprospiraceae bacterium]|nr:TlpA family protein disulfide reductase [Saprospiraceae bacterium]
MSKAFLTLSILCMLGLNLMAQSGANPGKVVVLENYENINTYKSLVNRFKGKVILLDLWGTWCGPCKREFQFKDGLKKYIKDKDIVLVYVNIDRPNGEARWEKMINSANLTGYHVYANQDLISDLRKRFYKRVNPDGRKVMGLPTYVIIDRNGKVVNKNAPRPSSQQKLYSTLHQVL